MIRRPPPGGPGGALRRTFRGILTLGALLAVAGCASTSSRDNPFAGGGGGGGDGAIRIHVENFNFNEATLHALSSGSRYRMGTVEGKQSGDFRVPWSSQQQLRVEIDLLAGGEYVTRPLNVSPGNRVQLYIQADVRRSYLQR